ncbi:Hemolymph lipopolysaccharide-binding protein [Papilio xuthus]|uniref:Hemolymph lipopolysaccharide-binding protein n=1 Tax=Papilio xuthus TaxID=66420 RepID=A0A194PKG9_PAPXU|nr:Hemolymph lipopolysaccharide-binding protein [Papilio xuthus]
MAGEPNDATAEDDCVVMNKLGIYQDSKCNTWLPYICKKTMQSFREWNAECKSPFLDYKFNKELNKCYKFHTQPKSWRDAEKICEAEQAYLAIPNSQQEADHLSKITNDNPKNYEGYYLSGAVHLGYRFDETIEDWVTLKGETLEQAGYSVWNYYQPDGGEKEYCGGMFYNGEFNDISCETQDCYFICERDIDEIGGKTGKN